MTVGDGTSMGSTSHRRAPAQESLEPGRRLHQALERVAAGRPDSDAGLFDTIGGQLYAVAAVVTGRPSVAEAVVVEAFLEVAGSAAMLQGDPDAAVRILSLTQRLARDRIRPRPILV